MSVSRVPDLAPDYDVVIAGARCAGAATALLLARQGLRVLVAERGERGADTLSTLALMRGGVVQLSRWGVLDAVRAAGTPPIETTAFVYDGARVEIRIKPRDGVDALYAPRRTVLDPILADAAADAGATVLWRTRVREVIRDDRQRVAGVALQDAGGVERRIRASWVVGADGVHSTVAAAAAARTRLTGAHAAAVIFTLVPGLDVRGYEWHFVPGASAGVIPTNAGDVLVFASAPRQRFMDTLRHDLARGFHQILDEAAPGLSAHVRACGGTRRFRGFAGIRGFMRDAWGPGWALVGDAGYFKDPLTAHGITDALRDAELLARALASGTHAAMAEYQTLRDALSLPLFEITDEIASYGWTMPRLGALHKAMSEEMSREARFLAALDTPLVAQATS